MSKIPLSLEGRGNPYEDVCASARDVVLERGALRPRRADAPIDGVSGSALALRGDAPVASANSTRGLSWGDVALFLPQWRVVTTGGAVDLSPLSPPTNVRVEPHYPLLLTNLDWMLSGAMTGQNRLPNGDFRDGAVQWTVIKGTVQMGWTGTGGYAAWFLGAGASTPPYPSYAGIGSAPFPIDKSKPYSLLFDSICEPYDRYTYDNLPPQIVMRVWQRTASGRIGTEPLLVYASGEAAHATGARGVWHRHIVLGGVIHPHNSGLTPAWDANATHAEIEVFTNFNKQRVANIRFLEGGLPPWRVENGRRIARWELNPPPEPLTCEAFVPVSWELTDIWSIRFEYIRIYGIASVQDDALQLVLENEDGERYTGRILSYRRKDALVGAALHSVVYEHVELDCSMARGQTIQRIGLAFNIAESTSESPIVEIGSPVADAGGSEIEGFAVYGHGGVPRGRAHYYIIESRNLGIGLLASPPIEVEVELPVHSYHGVRLHATRAQSDTTLRAYRLVRGGYYLVGERNTDGDIVDMGNIGESYRASGVLPDADTGVVWGGRMVVGKVGERIVWVSGQHDPLAYAETALQDEDGYTLLLSEPLRAIGAELDAVLLYGQTRTWRLTRYAPAILLEDYTLLPDTYRHVDWGVVVSRRRVAVRGRIIHELPDDFSAGGARLGQDGSLFIWSANAPEAYVLTEDGWARWSLPTVVQDALMVDGYWIIVSEAGCWRLCGGEGRLNGYWVSGWFAAEGTTRPLWLWLRGSATATIRRLEDNQTRSQRIHNNRWQPPLGGVARAWRVELELNSQDVVYGLAVEGEMGEVR